MAFAALHTFTPQFAHFLDLVILQRTLSSPVTQGLADHFTTAGVLPTIDGHSDRLRQFWGQGNAEFLDGGYHCLALVVGMYTTKSCSARRLRCARRSALASTHVEFKSSPDSHSRATCLFSLYLSVREGLASEQYRLYLFQDVLTHRRTDGALVRLTIFVPTGGEMAAADGRLGEIAELVAGEMEAFVPN